MPSGVTRGDRARPRVARGGSVIVDPGSRACLQERAGQPPGSPALFLLPDDGSDVLGYDAVEVQMQLPGCGGSAGRVLAWRVRHQPPLPGRRSPVRGRGLNLFRFINPSDGHPFCFAAGIQKPEGQESAASAHRWRGMGTGLI